MRPVIQAAVIRADAQMGEQYLVGPALGWRPSVLLRSASCVLARQRAGAPISYATGCVESIQGTISGSATPSMSRLTTIGSWPLRTTTHSSGSSARALIS